MQSIITKVGELAFWYRMKYQCGVPLSTVNAGMTETESVGKMAAQSYSDVM